VGVKNTMLILASSSPRRYDLLKMLGLSFAVEHPNVSEDVDLSMEPEKVVEILAKRKAQAIANTKSCGFIIGSDTIVLHNGSILGKPKDEQHAVEMLLKLQGDVHYVYSGVAVIDARTKKTVVDYRKTKVFFKSLDLDEISHYVSTKESLDKAGAYGIQGRAAVFIEKIEGCYFNVMGLPLECLASMLKEFNYDIIKGY